MTNFFTVFCIFKVNPVQILSIKTLNFLVKTLLNAYEKAYPENAKNACKLYISIV